MKLHHKRKLQSLKLHNQIKLLLFVYYLEIQEIATEVKLEKIFRYTLVHLFILGAVLFFAPPQNGNLALFVILGAISYTVILIMLNTHAPKVPGKVHWIGKPNDNNITIH